MIINQNVILKEGLLNISSKDAFLSLYEDIKLQGAESFYYKKIKNLQNSDFKTLRPYFNDSESSEFELFLISKKKKQDEVPNNLLKSKTFKDCYELKKSEARAVDLDDDVIIDDNFAVLLNQDREIIVEGKLYKYQENGVFEVPEERIADFRAYQNGSKLKSSYNKESFIFHKMNYKMDIVEDCGSYGGSVGSGTSAPEPVFEDAMKNFEITTFRRNPSLWGDLFGYSRKEIISLPDSKRVKIKYWDQNWVFFKSFGAEIRFQKRVTFLWISGWQKSYPKKIKLGLNNLQYNYDKGAGNYFTNSYFHRKLYSYQGYNYFSDGTKSYTPPLDVAFPLAVSLGLSESIKLTKISPYTDFNFSMNLTQHEYAGVVNTAGSALLNLAVNQIPSILNIPTENPSLFKTEFFRNGTTVEIINKMWKGSKDYEENNITKIFDIDVPSISFTAQIGASGESFFSNPNVSFPNLNFDTYKTSFIDFYGAVLYKNVWYGKRMVSYDFKR
jgi:hypothetical protein